jgi:hypothetical protein
MKTCLKFEISGIPFVRQSHSPTRQTETMKDNCRFPGSIKFKYESLMIMVCGLSANAFKAWPQTVCFNVGPRIHNSNLDNRCTTTFSTPVEGLTSRALVVQRKSIRLHQYPPPGSGYLGAEDEKCYLPDTYEPTMEYPGTLRPGKTRENISFQDLPIGDDDPDPIPWPHFQEIDFYHVWPAPHPDPKPIDDMIAEFGRWATPEEEAEMMRDARRGARLMKEMQEAEKKAFVLVDDDDDEPAEQVEDEGDAIVNGLREQIKGKQTTSKPLGKKQRGADTIIEGEDEAIDFSELNFDENGDDEDDFLFDLGWVVLFSKLALFSILSSVGLNLRDFIFVSQLLIMVALMRKITARISLTVMMPNLT